MVDARAETRRHLVEVSDQRLTVRAAVAKLPVDCQKLLPLLVSDAEPTYAEIAEMLGWPRGSVGPMRLRCLERLRKKLDREAYQ